jgi:hypothetical protein
MLAIQMENQRLLGQAVNSTLQHNPQFQNQAQFISPGMMQMPQNIFQNTMLPPQQLNRTTSSYRPNPYPQQPAKPSSHQRSASFATPQESPPMQQYHQPTQATSTQQVPQHDRRMSLPPNVEQQSLRPRAPAQAAGYTSQHDSVPTTPTHQNHTSTSPDVRQLTPHQEMSNPFAPFTTTLPLDAQQILAGSENFPILDIFGQAPDYPVKPQQPFYSYRPNSSGNGIKGPSSQACGLDQTLLGSSIDTNINGSSDNASYIDTPSSAHTGPLCSANTDSGFEFGYDGPMFNFDPLGTASGMTSGHATPRDGSGYNEPMFNDFLDQDMFGEMHSQV